MKTCSRRARHVVIDILESDEIVGCQGYYGKDDNDPARISKDKNFMAMARSTEWQGYQLDHHGGIALINVDGSFEG